MSAVPSFRPDEYRGALPPKRQRADDVVGYTFNADAYCLTCMRAIAAFALAPQDSRALRGGPGDAEETEAILTRWAERERVNRDDESTFDSDTFPKVVFADSAAEGDTCGRCYVTLLQR